MCWLGSFALLTFFMVTTSGQVVHDCAAVQLNKPNAEQISFDLQEKKKDVEVKVRVTWDMPDLGDCQPTNAKLVSKLITYFGAKVINHHRETDVQMGGGETTVEIGKDGSVHIMWYTVTLQGPEGDSVTLSSPPVRFEPTICAASSMTFDQPPTIQQVSPGTVNVTWRGLDSANVKCMKQLKIDYMKDPLREVFKGGFYGQYKTVFVEKNLAQEESLASVLVKVPLDTFMNFRISVGVAKDDQVVWIESPTETFKSNTEKGCGSRVALGYGVSKMDTSWLPNFEGEDLDGGLEITMDEDGETVVVDWSRLNITNRNCLNGFVVDCQWMCETCDYMFGISHTMVPSDENRLLLRVEESNFRGKAEYKRGHGFLTLPVTNRFVTIGVRTTWRLKGDANGRSASAKFLIDPKV